MNATDRRALAIAAITSVNNGTLAGDAETDIVDFKEEKGTIAAGESRIPISDRHQEAAAALASEAACMSNSSDGGVLVVGVNDHERGSAAFVDTYLDLRWLRERIHNLTVPSLSVDEIEEYPINGKRVYLINVHPGLEEVRVNGVLRGRKNKACVELSGDDARRFIEDRRNFDWSAEDSRMRLSQAAPEALTYAMTLYRDANQRDATSSLELLRRLGLLFEESDDPLLTQAGALLLCASNDARPLITLLATQVEGSPSRTHKDFTGPLVLAFRDTWGAVQAEFPITNEVVGAFRQAVQAIPPAALREALVNALMHRDYRHDRSAVVALITGFPSDTFKVTSPGGFPPGVDESRLLTTKSRPRNPALATALRGLGIGEGEGIGIDVMYTAMLRDGHPLPEIVESGGDVVCRLTGGRLDLSVREFFDNLYKTDSSIEHDAQAHVVVVELLKHPTMRAEWLIGPAQCTPGEADELLDKLLVAGVLERLLDGSRSFRLTSVARSALHSRITYQTRQSFEEQWDIVRALFDQRQEISAVEVRTALGLAERDATPSVLSKAKAKGLLVPTEGRTRGRGVRYSLTDEGRNYSN